MRLVAALQEMKDVREGKTHLPTFLFAKSIDIHPGIFVGRLQDDGLLKKSAINDLKVKVEQVEEPSNPPTARSSSSAC